MVQGAGSGGATLPLCGVCVGSGDRSRRYNSALIFIGAKEQRVKIKNRQQLLTMAAIVVVALFAADKLLLTPLGSFWSERSKQISTLRKKVEEGRQLIRRDDSLRSRWNQMRTNTLPNT